MSKSINKIKHKLLWLFLPVFALSIFFAAGFHAHAASDMSVHAIYLKDANGDNGYGDAVLVESEGEFLLMDTACGSYDYQDTEDDYVSTSASLIKYLVQVGAGTEDHPLDIYISHVHADHYGGLQEIIESGKFPNIRTLYMPDEKLGLAVLSSRSFVYEHFGDLAEANGITVKYLYPTSGQNTFSIGAATGKIIGPVKIYTSSNTSGTNEELENNNSLCAMITCNGFKFLTMGDALFDSELDLIDKLGASALKADLLKQDHHGYDGANHTDFIDAVQAPKTFACVNRSITYNTRIYKKYSAYGEVLNTPDAGETVIYQKDSATGKVERSLCSHPLSKKTFRRTWTSVYTNDLTITCSECGTSKTVKEFHGCTHELNKNTGNCDVPGCPYFCPHYKNKTWKNGVCTICGFTCKHLMMDNTNHYVRRNGATVRMWDQNTRKCKVCGMIHTHKWSAKKGMCTICKKVCKHPKWNKKKGRCTTCGWWCTHSKWNKKTARCKTCGFKCTHRKYNKTTHKYVKKNGKYISTFNKKGVCKVCKFKCKHKKKKKGVCLICGKKFKKKK